MMNSKLLIVTDDLSGDTRLTRMFLERHDNFFVEEAENWTETIKTAEGNGQVPNASYGWLFLIAQYFCRLKQHKH